jgi:CHASE3 domain sensor protein
MKNFREMNKSLDLVNEKLDLILELVNAKRTNNKKLADEIRKKLDLMKDQTKETS